MLVRIIKNWDSPDLKRQTPGTSGHWDDVQFTFDDVEECDAVIVLNTVTAPVRVYCSPDNVWALMQEPYVPGSREWMVNGHERYSYVFTHHQLPRFNQKKYIRCQPAVPWHVNKNYDELKLLNAPTKQKQLSWITSNLTLLPGHKARVDFLNFLGASNITIDIYGKGINFIEDKWDGLAPYRYSLAIENSSSPDYWTEKVADCFLSWTVPIYYGCTNLEEYFPSGAFIRIDITRPQEALEIIRNVLVSDDWDSRLHALKEARELVLDKYQFFPQACNLIERYHKKSVPKQLELHPYRERNVLLKKLRRRLSWLLGRA